jgi:hypothetical protein
MGTRDGLKYVVLKIEDPKLRVLRLEDRWQVPVDAREGSVKGNAGIAVGKGGRLVGAIVVAHIERSITDGWSKVTVVPCKRSDSSSSCVNRGEDTIRNFKHAKGRRLDRVHESRAAGTDLDRAPATFPSGNRQSKTNDVFPPQGRAVARDRRLRVKTRSLSRM